MWNWGEMQNYKGRFEKKHTSRRIQSLVTKNNSKLYTHLYTQTFTYWLGSLPLIIAPHAQCTPICSSHSSVKLLVPRQSHNAQRITQQHILWFTRWLLFATQAISEDTRLHTRSETFKSLFNFRPVVIITCNDVKILLHNNTPVASPWFDIYCNIFKQG